ncbi:hypothetical protein VU05_00060 [Desulfobulbus sp. F1]|nr:hypothetical protein [Desulfobulbus sp. F1]
MKHSLLRHCVVAAFFAALSAAPLAAEVQKNQTPAAEIYSNLETFATILDMVQKHYVEETRGTDILAGAVNGMLGTLDPHSSYLSPKDFKELQEDTSGSFSGVGIETTVSSPSPEHPPISKASRQATRSSRSTAKQPQT